jgi:hypothetical protein
MALLISAPAMQLPGYIYHRSGADVNRYLNVGDGGDQRILNINY